MTDKVIIEGLKVETVIGIYDWERAITQPLFFDVIMDACHLKAAETDDVADVINYQAVCERINSVCQQTQAQLLERLAQVVADMILAEFNVDKVFVKIMKPTAINQAKAVGVQIERSKPKVS